MAEMTDRLVPALEDARQTHAAVLDRFRADITVTPPGPYRQMLERQATEVQDSLQRIEHHVRDLRPRGLLSDTVDMARFISRSAMHTAMLPLTIGSVILTGVLRGGRTTDERRLLKNAEDEYAAAARALVSSQAGEVLAEHVYDQDTADLLGSLRRQDRELLEALEDSVAENARAVAATKRFGLLSTGGGGLADAAAQVVRNTFDRVRDVAQTGGRRARSAAVGAMKEMPEATRMAEEVKGAAIREEDLAIPRFSQLSIDEIKGRLHKLSQSDLTVIEGYERAHANRKGVMEAIDRLRAREPWTGYDAMAEDQIVNRLQNVSSSEARQVLEYERRHRERGAVISAAEARLPM
jgi:hypothetical protein